MPKKRLVVCADGTWNRPESEGSEGRQSTNVLKLLRAVKHVAGDGTPQIVFYDKGVGTGGWYDRLVGGGLGIGLSENVLDCYRFVANNHCDGDEIHLFGFSRGAFTVRSLGGLISVIGLVDKVHMGKLPDGYRYYRTPPEDRPRAQDLLKNLGTRRTDIAIECIGVWDTVGALGIPISIFKNLGAGRYRFHDTNLGRNVRHAFHALAIDEKRKPFQPALWQEGPSVEGPPVESRTVEQVWFAGVHSNIGGGYPDAGLSDIALSWMLERVSAVTDLEFDQDYVSALVKPNAGGELYDSYRSYYRLLGPNARTIGAGSSIHPSVAERKGLGLKPPYGPENVPT